MKILLVRSDIGIAKKYTHPINFRPPYALKYIQTLLAENFRTRFVDAYAQSLPLDELSNLTFAFDPDVVVVSSTSLDIETTRDYIKIIKHKKAKAIIMVIGPGPSSLPNIYAQNDMIDFVLRGEPELEACLIIKSIARGEAIEDLHKSYNRSDENGAFMVKDLDRLPFINYSEEEIPRYTMNYPLSINKRLRWGHILSSRGCPYECMFCSPLMRDSYGKELRLRSPKNVVDEIEYQLSLGINVICFDDDNFTTSPDHVRAICREILKRRIKFPWVAHARIDNLDREMMKLMKEAGCCLLRIGVESGSQRIIDIIKKTDQPDWVDRTKSIFNIAKDLKIDTAALFIVGSPTETKEEVLQSVELARELRPDIIQVCFFTPFPGSGIYEKNRYNFNLQDLGRMHQYGGASVINLSNMRKEDLVETHKIFYRSFLFKPKFVFRHIIKYFWFYFFNLNVFFSLFNIQKYLGRKQNSL